ncbi:MAG: NYN domain-containing protein [Defluviitaleaceae bacterium]|nr:NYN domain-containing protein [Defluviitaleaceae bacterium]MCL2263744.1 NYN domain-containing protein [Defluviitaleaceae bacterium]
MLCNTAVFYDIENLLGLFGGKTNTVLHLDEIYRRVLEMEGVHGVSIQRAYADWALPQHRNLRNSVLQVGIEPVQIFNTNQHDKVKNAADVCLIIDAVDLISKQPEIENYVIASGDGIFAFLAKKLHERGKRVIGVAFDKITNNIFRNACDYFVALEKADTSIVATSSRRKSKASAPVSAISETESVPQTKNTGNFPKTKFTEALESADIEILRDSTDSSACFHVVRKMVDALFSGETQDLPGLEVSVFTMYMNHYLPNFKVTRHGFKRVGEFMRFILSGSPFCMHSIADNVLLIAPRDSAKGTIMDDVNGLLITGANGGKYNSVFNVPHDEPFIYKILPTKTATAATTAQPPLAAKVKKPPAPAKKPKELPAEKPKEIPAPPPPEEASSIRKWIKDRFEELAEADAIPTAEVRKLLTPEYAMSTFGVRTPIFREIETRSNLTEQRTANGKIKYWKESFRFNNKTYIVYKEWVAGLHRDRFCAWLNTLRK